MTAAVQTVTETAKGLTANVVGTRDHRYGDAVAVAGASGAAVVIAMDKSYGTLNLTCAGLTGTNDFDLPVGEHGQEIKIVLASKGAGNATVTVDGSATIVDIDGDAVTTITFDTAAKYAILRYDFNTWRLIVETSSHA